MPSARSRRQRRQRGQYTGVLQKTTKTQAARPVPQQIEPRYGRKFNWRIVSGLLVLVLSGLLVFFFVSDTFYVNSATVAGLRYMTKEEVFTLSDVEGRHIFWVSPAQVRDSVMRSPSVADARVSLSWPPDMVNISIDEREPALLWQELGVEQWVDVRGRVMSRRQERGDLLRISTDEASGRAFVSEGQLDPAIVFGALELQELLPDIANLRYDTVRGLGYTNNQGVQVWFGVGTGMDEKYALYQAVSDLLAAQGTQASLINVVNPDHPYYTINP